MVTHVHNPLLKSHKRAQNKARFLEKNALSQEKEKTHALFKKGMKFISKNGHPIVSKITGVKTEEAVAAGKYLVGSADALKKGKYKVAAAASIASLSAGLLVGTHLLMTKELRDLNKVSACANPR